MTANLVLRMTTMGDKSENKSGITCGKGLKVAMFWLQVFGDLGMAKNNKGSIIYSFSSFLVFMLIKKEYLIFKFTIQIIARRNHFELHHWSLFLVGESLYLECFKKKTILDFL